MYASSNLSEFEADISRRLAPAAEAARAAIPQIFLTVGARSSRNCCEQGTGQSEEQENLRHRDLLFELD